MRRNRPLQDDAEHVAVVVHRQQAGLALLLREVVRPGLLLEAKLYLGGGLSLAARVDRGRILGADADGHQPSDLMGGGRVADAFRDLEQNPIADGTPVE